MREHSAESPEAAIPRLLDLQKLEAQPYRCR
jgi:hypothetical protein